MVRKLYAPLATGVQVILDAGTVLLSCALAYAVWSRTQTPEAVQPIRFYLQPFLLMAVLQVILFRIFGMYRLQKSLLNIEEFRGLCKATGWGVLLLYTILALLRESTVRPAEGGLYDLLHRLHAWIALAPIENYSRFVLVGSHVVFLVLASIQRFLVFRLHQRLHQAGIGHLNVLLYGAGPMGQRMQKRFRLSPRLGYHLVGFLDDDPAARGKVVGGSAVVRGGVERFEEIARTEEVKLVFVADPQIAPDTIGRLFRISRRLGIEVRAIPPFYDVFPRSVSVSYFDSIPFLTVRRDGPGTVTRGIKRTFDVIGAGIALLVTSPLFLLLPPLLRRRTGGSAFFTQERVGQGGRTFPMLKFRTMHVDAAPYAVKPSDAEDPRITPLGRLLRRWSLDELPQLWNVIRGDMSLVGPRPEMPFIVAGYGDFARERLLAKPGITGLWQISSAREEAIHLNVDYDIYYIENQSFLLDLIVLGLTAVSVFRGAGAH